LPSLPCRRGPQRRERNSELLPPRSWSPLRPRTLIRTLLSNCLALALAPAPSGERRKHTHTDPATNFLLTFDDPLSVARRDYWDGLPGQKSTLRSKVARFCFN
jgi:hypothetical protein